MEGLGAHKEKQQLEEALPGAHHADQPRKVAASPKHQDLWQQHHGQTQSPSPPFSLLRWSLSAPHPNEALL